MKKSTKRHLLRSGVFGLLLVFAFSLVTPITAAAMTDDSSTNHNDAVTATETKTALADTASILGASDQIVVKTDADSAMLASTAGTTVDVPKDPEQGVTFGAQTDTTIEIGLPNAEAAGVAKMIAPGVVAYDSGNGSANAVQATEDGGVRMLTVIDNPNAPTEYEYKVTVPDDGYIALTEDGGAAVFTAQGEPLYVVSAPWAKDAEDKMVRTWFTTDGKTLVQHVEHNVAGVVYPVTADPFWNRLGNYLGCILGAGVPMGTALVIAAMPATWYSLTAASSGARAQTTMGKYIIWVKDRCAAFIRS